MARIGYAKVGRSYNLNPDKATSIGGDIDVLNCLIRLAKAYPQHTFVLVGKNSGEDPREFGYPDNIENPWTEWKNDWTVVPDPAQADMMIDHFRRVSGDFHKTLDHMIVWAGQHGSANSRIPMIGNDWTRPPGTCAQCGGSRFAGRGTGYDSVCGECGGQPEFNLSNDIITGGEAEALATPQFAFVHYVSWLCDFISRWRESGPGPTKREEIWLCPDPRNYLKLREKRWPLRYPVIAQYDFLKYHKGERYGRFPPELFELDPTGYREQSLWVTNTAYCYGALELTAVGDPKKLAFDPRPGPHAFGMVVNENLQGVADNRLALLKTWILPNFPGAEIRGHWTEKSQIDLNRVIQPVPYPEVMATMKSFATTITTPASGSEWATAKPWECFAIGSICFFHPRYDGQGHIIPLKDGTSGLALRSADSELLAQVLRVDSAEMLAERVREVTETPELYFAIVTAQRRHYEAAFEAWAGGTRAIGERIATDLARIENDVTIMAGERHADQPWLNYTEVPAPTVQGRSAPRPRGTNEERKKKKPPVSRRRALKGLPTEDVSETVVNDVAIVEASKEPDPPVSDGVEKSKLRFPYTGSFQGFNLGNLNSTATEALKVTTKKDVPRAERWPRRFLALAQEVASWSKDPSTKCGCVLVDERRRVVAVGYNGLPDRIVDDPAVLADRDMKRGLVIHAEMNAIFNCAVSTVGLHAYATHPSCGECAKMLVGAGIASFTAYEGDPDFTGRWACDDAADVFRRAGVPYKLLKR